MTRLVVLICLLCALAGAGCSNPFSIDKTMDEVTYMMQSTGEMIASGPIPLVPLEP